MSDITNIDEIIKTANVKSDFQGFIADKASLKHLFNTTIRCIFSSIHA